MEISSFEEYPAVLTVRDLARCLRVGRNTAYRYVRLGKIRSIRVGRQIRIPRDFLVEFLKGVQVDNT